MVLKLLLTYGTDCLVRSPHQQFLVIIRVQKMHSRLWWTKIFSNFFIFSILGGSLIEQAIDQGRHKVMVGIIVDGLSD